MLWRCGYNEESIMHNTQVCKQVFHPSKTTACQPLIKPLTSIIKFVVKKPHLKRKLDTDQEHRTHAHMKHMHYYSL